MLAPVVRWRGLLLLAIVAFGLFANALGAPFHFDDLHSIQFNPHIRSLWDVGRHFVDPSTFSSRVSGFMYRPVLMTTYSFDYALWGASATGFRVVNLLLHVTAAALFGRLAARWVGRGAGIGATVLFLVHPLHSEAVIYISSRSDLLVAVLGLAVLLMLETRRWWPALPGYTAALLSKSVAVTVPVLAVILTVAMGGWQAVYRQRWRYALLALLSAAYLGILWHTQFLSTSYDKLPRSVSGEIWTQVKALVYYGWLSTQPVHLNVDHAFAAASGPADAVVVAALLLVASIAGFSLRYHRQVLSRCVMFFGVTMGPYLLVPLNIMVSERRVYLASCGLLLAAVWTWRAARLHWGAMLRPVGVALCLVLTTLTLSRNQVWATEVDLWQDAVRKNSSSARPRLNLALAYKRRSEPALAQMHLTQGLRLDPNFAEGWVVYGQLRSAAGDLSGALEAYRRGAALDPMMAGVHHDLGNVSMALGLAHSMPVSGWFDSAEVHYRRVLALAPQFAEARNNLGYALQLQGRWQEALGAYRRAVDDSMHWTNTDDNVGGAWYNRARAAEHLGLEGEALTAYEAAARNLAADPRHADKVAWARQQRDRIRQRLAPP